ncbi:GNAT family N-acetyltransferase [Maricaulis parjimensis]|uniref:GNAT family N-acetyltransferase n=1 Tax=Maricaulis parjimensis TaxID=144023 RepID=UPI0019395853|nr:GNAT family N-acetyltransferase [Maricaulis parjimensis]
MDIQISLEETGSKGRYVARIAGQQAEGEMTFSRISPTRIIVDHTGVPDELRGMGIAQALALHVVAEARANGFIIVPLCPFLKTQADKHPDWADVIEGVKA